MRSSRALDSDSIPEPGDSLRRLVAAAEVTLAAWPNDALASAVRLARHDTIDAAEPEDDAQAVLR